MLTEVGMTVDSSAAGDVQSQVTTMGLHATHCMAFQMRMKRPYDVFKHELPSPHRIRRFMPNDRHLVDTMSRVVDPEPRLPMLLVRC